MRTGKVERMPASSQASRELSTASLTVVRRALAGLSNPSRCLFFVKNSLTEISRCFEAIDSAVARRGGLGGASTGLMFRQVSIILDVCQVWRQERPAPLSAPKPAPRGGGRRFCFRPSRLRRIGLNRRLPPAYGLSA